MKITILQGAFLPVPSCRGGAIEKAWFALGKAFTAQGHKVTHISRQCDGLPSEEFIGGVHHKRILGRNAVRNPYLLKLLELPYIWRARKILLPADIIVTNCFWAPMLFPSEKVGKIYVHVGRYPKGQLILYGKAKRLQVPSIGVAQAVEKEIKDKIGRVSVIPYPIPWEIENLVPVRDRPKQLLYFGRIHPEKGVLSLIKAWKKINQDVTNGWKLRVIGPWRSDHGGGGLEYRNKIKNEIGEEESKIELLEPIFDTSQIKREYQSARIFIYPSLAEKGETFGLSVLESMSMGCIPIVSELKCFNDIMPEDASFIVPNSNHFENSLRETIQTVIMKESKHQVFSTLAYEKSKKFTVEKVARKFLEDFKELNESVQ